ncbi:MAG TPA: PilZ domain-containing protein [Azospirillaceae bacterium]|nr:PilZ domain-containing protein [Azospirillaceae bacterium]
MRLADSAVRMMRTDAEAGSADSLDKKVCKFEELLKSDAFPPQRASEYRDKLKSLRREAFQKSVDLLLHQIENASRTEDFKGRNDLVGKARNHLASAMRYGADEDFRKGVERRIGTALLMTAEGIDKRAKEAAERKAAEELKEKRSGAPGGVERRRAIRYGSPPLTVTIDGQTYETANWSVRGILIEAIRADLEPGDTVRLDLSCEGIEGGGRVTAHVVDSDADTKRLAFDFGAICPVVLGLMHGMRAAGIRPSADR